MKSKWIAILLLPCLYGWGQDTIVLDYNQCRERALKTNIDLRLAQNQTLSADYQRREVMAKFFPDAKGIGMTLYSPDQKIFSTSNNMADIDLLLRGTYFAGFTITQPIFAGGQIVNAYRLAKEGAKASEEQQRLIRDKMVADLAQSYWTYVATRAKVKMLNEYATQLDSTLSQVQFSVSIGMANEADLLQAQTAYHSLQYQLGRVQTGVELCRLALSNMIDLNPDSVFLLPMDETSDIRLCDTDNASVNNRPEIRLLEQQQRITTLQKKMVIGKYLPSIGLMASYTWYGNVDIRLSTQGLTQAIGPTVGALMNHLVASGIPLTQGMSMPQTLDGEYTYSMKGKMPSIMLSVSVPITAWGEGAYAIKRAKLNEENARLECEKNTKLLTLEMQQAKMTVLSSWDLVQSSEVALQSATEQLRIMRDRYEVGLCTMLDLLNAQSSWQSAESDHIEALTQYRINETNYLRTIGQP